MSAIWNGPKNGSRKPKQLRTTSSTSCGEASPSSTHLRASRNNAFWIRFATKPGPSPTIAGRFPVSFRNPTTRSTTSGSVAAAGMTSTPGVHSGGLNQCTPRNLFGCSTAPARSSIGSEEVLETMTASGCAAFEQAARISCLRSRSSNTASKTSPASLEASGALDQPLLRLPGHLRRRVREPHLDARGSEALCDAEAHRPGPNHGYSVRPALIRPALLHLLPSLVSTALRALSARLLRRLLSIS